MNLPSHSTDKLFEKLEKYEVKEDLFDEILTQVKMNLTDTFMRFSQTQEYNQLKEQLNVEYELMKETGIETPRKV